MSGPDARAFVAKSSALRHAKQPMPSHQSRHPITTGRLAVLAQSLMHARPAHHAIAGLVVFTNPHQQALVVGLAGNADQLAPQMKDHGRHLAASTTQLERVKNTHASAL